ncbi:Formate/nitrite transporter [Aureococcus anophagefferens]|nr:Formate/nitrite transporter [Aureococcus anophagefferens]
MGLLMVLGGGGELVTGNMAVCSAAWQAKKASFKQLITNLGVVYAGNLVGSLAVAFIANMAATGIAPGAIAVASGKVAQTFGAAFAKGILCNWLAHKDLASKAAAVFFPISGFIACGFEHSVANMFLLPFGILQGADITVGQAVVKNLIPVTLGNLVGGAIFVGAFYHNAYGKRTTNVQGVGRAAPAGGARRPPKATAPAGGARRPPKAAASAAAPHRPPEAAASAGARRPPKAAPRRRRQRATASCLASYAEAADAPPPPALLARPPSDDVIDAPAVLEIPGRARRHGVVGGLCAWPPPVDARRELLAASVVAAGLAARFAALRLLAERGGDGGGDADYPPAWVQ